MKPFARINLSSAALRRGERELLPTTFARLRRSGCGSVASTNFNCQ